MKVPIFSKKVCDVTADLWQIFKAVSRPHIYVKFSLRQIQQSNPDRDKMCLYPIKTKTTSFALTVKCARQQDSRNDQMKAERQDVCIAKLGRNGLYEQGESPPEFLILQFKLWKKFSVVWLTSAVQPSEPEPLTMLTCVSIRLLKYGAENVRGCVENPNIFFGGVGGGSWNNKNSTYILKYWKLQVGKRYLQFF